MSAHCCCTLLRRSGKKKQHKPKLFGPDFPRTFLTLTPECPGVKKFLPTAGAAGKRTFWCGRPRFSARTSMTRRVVEKLCTKRVCVDFLAPRREGVRRKRGGGNLVEETPSKGNLDPPPPPTLSGTTGRIRFWRARFQTPSSVIFLALAKLW